MKKTTRQPQSSLAATLAPEDVRKGDYVALLTRTYELPSYLWNDAFKTDVVRLRLTAPDSGRPMKVRSICLPFVHVSCGRKKRKIVDLRTAQIVRVGKKYAKRVLKDIAKRRL